MIKIRIIFYIYKKFKSIIEISIIFIIYNKNKFKLLISTTEKNFLHNI